MFDFVCVCGREIWSVYNKKSYRDYMCVWNYAQNVWNNVHCAFFVTLVINMFSFSLFPSTARKVALIIDWAWSNRDHDVFVLRVNNLLLDEDNVVICSVILNVPEEGLWPKIWTTDVAMWFFLPLWILLFANHHSSVILKEWKDVNWKNEIVGRPVISFIVRRF